MSEARTLLNPGHRHVAGFVLFSLLLHVILFVWYALQGATMFTPQGGALGIGGGEDIIFQLSRGDSGGIDQEIPESELEFQQTLPDQLTEDALDAPLVEDETAVPVAPSETPADAAAKAAAAKAALAASQAAKKQAGGDSGDAEKTRRNRAGTALSGAGMASAFSGRTLHLTAGRLDIPGGNRLMDLKIHLFPDGTTRVNLVYFHYKTFHKEQTSTRALKGDGAWWIEGDSICFRAMVVNYGAADCYEMNQLGGGELQLYFDNCTARSSSLCEPMRLGARGSLSPGID